MYSLTTSLNRSKIYAGVGNATGSVGRTLFGGIITAGKADKLLGNVIVMIQSRRMDDKRGVDAIK